MVIRGKIKSDAASERRRRRPTTCCRGGIGRAQRQLNQPHLTIYLFHDFYRLNFTSCNHPTPPHNALPLKPNHHVLVVHVPYYSLKNTLLVKERHFTATQTVNNLRDRLKQRRLSLLDTDGLRVELVSFGPTDLVCCRTLQGHTGKVLSLRSRIC